MSEPNGRDLLEEWRNVLESVITSAASAAGQPDLPKDVLALTQRQIETVTALLERERRVQGEVAGRVLAPVDAIFDLLEETGSTLRRQAEALGAAGRAIEETGELMGAQAEMFEKTIGTLRRPADIAKFSGWDGPAPEETTRQETRGLSAAQLGISRPSQPR